MNHAPLFFLMLLGLLTFTGCARPGRPPAARETRLTLSGLVDGSERFTFTAASIRWEHRHWSLPSGMRFQGVPWRDLRKTPVQWHELAGRDLAKATIVQRQGRDVIALEPMADGFILHLCDSPNGAGWYSVTIALPAKATP